MEGRRKTRPHTTASRIDLPEYENSLLPISTYPNISAFTERGQIVVGYMEPVGAVAIAAEGRQTLAMLRRRKDETFKQLLARLDLAIASATIDDVYVDEVNATQLHRTDPHHLLRPVVSTCSDRGHIRSYPARNPLRQDGQKITLTYLWHGNVFQALKKLEGLEMDIEDAAFETKDETARKLLKQMEDLHTYVERNQAFIPNYGERYRNGERIASGFVESAVNQVVSKRMVKHQQMQWTQRGAHMLLQIRTRVLNEEWEDTLRRWYPGFRSKTQENPVKKAA
jgi:hypothetical protein